jgi:serine/threonine-protein kinase
MPSPANDPLIGRTIAQRYRLISRLGVGASASVYLARHVLIERLSAIKVVHADLARDPLWRERFMREARAVNRINHPNIVEITDLGEADGLLFLVMEYMPGESLRQALERGPLGWRRAASLGQQVASALGRAHQMGVVHRGLDATNVLIVARKDGPDTVKLTDFGVAKLADAAPLTMRVPKVDGVTNLRDLDARSDLFALGEVLYEATCGSLPDTPAAPLADVPEFFAQVVSTLLAPDPDMRPRDGFEAADLLRRALEAEPAASLAPPPWRALAEPGASLPESMRASVRPAPVSEPPAPGDAARRGVRGVTVDRLARICAAALAVIDERVDAAAEVSEAMAVAVAEARRKTTTVAILSELVASDTQTLAAVQERGRHARAELGRRLDEAARERSRALGWAGTIAERSYQVEVQRMSGDHPVRAIEVMVWEQAALEQEEDRARDAAAGLDSAIALWQREADRHTERLEHELEVVDACLEGRIAALRSVAAEAWVALEAAAARAGVRAEELSGSGPAFPEPPPPDTSAP